MARELNKLSARAVATLTKPGRHSDGGGLYLSVSTDGGTTRRRWVFLFRWDGKLKEMGLGGLDSVPLARARELAAACRLNLAGKRNPLEVRRAAQDAERQADEAKQAAALAVRTFGQVADEYLADHAREWSNGKTAYQWHQSLHVYAGPLRPIPVAEITTEHVFDTLKPIWTEKPETARRTRNRIEAVLDAARARGLVPAHLANPARWHGHLDHLLSPPPRPRHHKAMAFKDVPAFVARLRERKGVSPRALEFVILTAARLGEVLGMRWGEIDLDDRVWECPAERMKARKPHRVPLSARALAILTEVGPGAKDAFVFPGQSEGRPLSNMVMKRLSLRMGLDDMTSHGFRSSFRDWAGECTNFPREVCEAALAHAVGNAVELSYRRGDALEKRRVLMETWAAYCEPRKDNVVPLTRSA